MLFMASVIKRHHFPSSDCEYELQGIWKEVVVA